MVKANDQIPNCVINDIISLERRQKHELQFAGSEYMHLQRRLFPRQGWSGSQVEAG